MFDTTSILLCSLFSEVITILHCQEEGNSAQVKIKSSSGLFLKNKNIKVISQMTNSLQQMHFLKEHKS